MKKLIICDLDGCLIDSSWIWQVNKNLKLESPQCWELFENNSVSSWNEIDNFLLKFLREKLQQGFCLLFLTARSFTIENKTIDFITQKTGLVVGKDFLAEFRPMDDTSSPEDFKSRVVKRYLESGAEIELIGVDEKEYILKKIIDKVRRKYDYIIIDCPPSLNMLTINALTAANSVLVPIQCEYYALEGLSQLIHTIDLVKDRLNKKLVMEGVVFTMYDARTNLSLQVVENVKDNLQQNIYKTIIPRNVRLAEAPSYGQPITLYDTKSAGAEAYRLLAEEVINREDK